MVEVEWQRMKAQEVRSFAARNAVAILPVASIEQHGPHLPTMTDTRLGHEVAIRAARLASDTRAVIVAPVVWSGLSEHHMPFGGTFTIRPDTFRALIRDLVEALVRQGFRDILISNSHGGNIIALQQICDELAPQVDATLVMTTYPMEAAEEIGRLLEEQEGVQHACEAETAMMMACEGRLVDQSDLAGQNSDTASAARFLKAGKASYRWRPFTHVTGNGVSGKPGTATVEKGEALLKASAQALADLISDPETWEAAQDLRGNETGGVPFRDQP
ncbi:MAG: creatininase family protein [Sulfitobacter sp.]|nr:creatininase family protein [Sulfitobacter sp.]